MDLAGASRPLHALIRLLAGASLVALLALALLAAPGRAQAPPDAPPGQASPGQLVDANRPGEHGYARDPQDERGDGRRALLPPVAEEQELPAVTSTFVAGKLARMRTDGKAAIPRGAPKRVRALIAQYNRIAGKRYKWGGGHARLVDSGYDCSGAVGYGLITGGLQRAPLVSGSFARWGAAGAGRWVTVYAHRSHVYVEVAGLRLDTSPVGDQGGSRGVRWRPVIGQRRGFEARHPVGL